jgi:flagellar hook-basal body complex protein FliE
MKLEHINITNQLINNNNIMSSSHTTFPSFMHYLSSLNHRMNNEDKHIAQFVAGKPVNMSDLMIGLQSIKYELQLITQIKNKCIQAFQLITREV